MIPIHVIYSDLVQKDGYNTTFINEFILVIIDRSGRVSIEMDDIISDINPSSADIERDMHVLHDNGVRGTIVFLEQPTNKSSLTKLNIFGYEITNYGVWYVDYKIVNGEKIYRG